MSDDIDDYLKDLGFDDTPVVPRSREEQLYAMFTIGSAKRIDNMRYWLGHEMAKFLFILNNNIKVTKDVFKDKEVLAQPISKLDYAKLHVQYYLEMYHLSHFMKSNDGREPANMTKMVDMLVAYPDVKEVIVKDWS